VRREPGEGARPAEVLEALERCEDALDEVRQRRGEIGASLSLTFLLRRLQQHLRRVRALVLLLHLDPSLAPHLRTVRFLKEVVRAENLRHSLREHLSGNLDMLALQVTEHAGRTGGHYITTTRAEWWRMFRSAVGGGFVVAFLCWFKLLAYYAKLAPFGTAFLYSMNYSLGFIAIHVTQSTLATKQPAMTASRIAAALDRRKEGHSLDDLAELVVRTARSQFIAFVGNVGMSFPVALTIALLVALVSGRPLADPEKARLFLEELHPWRSLSLFHAAIAGVYLFLAGLISGYYDNAVVFSRIPERLRHHRLLRRVLGERLLDRLAAYVDKNLGSLAGNFMLGIFLGTTGTIGFILGLPLDIRHITFAAGNFGIALATLGTSIGWKGAVVTVLGIVAIGAVHFLVSFGLALTVAIRSRGVNFDESRLLLTKLAARIARRPLDVIVAPPDPQPQPQPQPAPGA
jgi:site-specific recombinase